MQPPRKNHPPSLVLPSASRILTDTYTTARGVMTAPGVITITGQPPQALPPQPPFVPPNLQRGVVALQAAVSPASPQGRTVARGVQKVRAHTWLPGVDGLMVLGLLACLGAEKVAPMLAVAIVRRRVPFAVSLLAGLVSHLACAGVLKYLRLVWGKVAARYVAGIAAAVAVVMNPPMRSLPHDLPVDQLLVAPCRGGDAGWEEGRHAVHSFAALGVCSVATIQTEGRKQRMLLVGALGVWINTFALIARLPRFLRRPATTAKAEPASSQRGDDGRLPSDVQRLP